MRAVHVELAVDIFHQNRDHHYRSRHLKFCNYAFFDKELTKTKAAKSSNNASDDLRLFAVHHRGAVHRKQAENNRDW